jgi:hypothetical protein
MGASGNGQPRWSPGRLSHRKTLSSRWRSVPTASGSPASWCAPCCARSSTAAPSTPTLTPANVFVTPDGRLALLDFGSVGRLDPLEQAGLRRMLLEVQRRDATGLTDAILEIVHRQRLVTQSKPSRTAPALLVERHDPGSVVTTPPPPL